MEQYQIRLEIQQAPDTLIQVLDVFLSLTKVDLESLLDELALCPTVLSVTLLNAVYFSL